MQQVKDKNLLAVLDYDSLVDYSNSTGNALEDILIAAKDSNINFVAITELPLYNDKKDGLQGFFSEDEQVSAHLGFDLLKQINLNLNNNAFTQYLTKSNIIEENIYLLVASEQRAKELYTAGLNKYGDKRVTKHDIDNNKAIIEIKNSKALPINGLGFDPKTIKTLKANSFNIVPRPFNAAYSKEDKQAFINYFEYMKTEFSAKTIIFAGKEGILGMPVGSGEGFLSLTAEQLQTKDSDKNSFPLYGHVEMATIKGDKKLATYLKYNLARVHSISNDEWKERYNSVANDAVMHNVVERYRLAYNDRNVHIFYIRPFSKSIEFNKEYFSKLTAISKSNSSISAVPGRLTLPKWVLALISIGVGCAFLLLFLQVFKNAQKLTFILLIIGIVGVLGASFVLTSYHLLMQKIVALTAAIVFPTLAIVVGFLWMNNVQSKLGLIKKLLVVFGITLMGGIYVHGSLATLRFMTSIDVFPMVKIALLMPIPLTFLILVLDNDTKNNIANLLNMNIKMYHALLAGIAVIALGLLVIRSGNNPSVGVSGIELKIRAVLQRILVARPRFKEFALGIPMIVLAAWLQMKKKHILIPLTIGSIGLASMVNTFAHLHKPLWMALLTSFNGIWVGIIVSAIFIIIYELISKTGIFEAIE
ncbi:hypothetical protein IMX26_09230 [Clostridium sp. 'deep sea']|uniref:DUF5693 family protein n=1 Tax=Clostridium sp. 'deep sea' TaxID=2779445 RepID=UPI0018968480|nr:DUF5693 family protein [Clostridium sp. 'deep sea']QOR33684.1 hypothetical protein IMX26_09230 [Clostridium sp. 'deep sea']